MATLTPFSGDYREHTEGVIYQANIRSYEQRDGDFGQFILWAIEGDEIADGTQLMTSAVLSKKSKLGGWLKALYPAYDFTTDFDLDTLVGLPVAVVFDHAQGPDGGWSEKGRVVAKGTSETKDYTPDASEAPF